MALPTITVETDAGPKLYRLPQPLGDWAFSQVALARQDRNLLPATVEFSRLQGRYTVDIE